MRTSIIVRYVGVSLILMSVMMAVSAAVAALDGFDDSMLPLLFSAAVTFIAGVYPMVFVRSESNIRQKEGIAIVVLSWISCCLFGMIPYVAYDMEFNLVDSLFESVSGFTTTGASILNDIEALPKGLLFWRASTAWVGGLGIVSIFSLVVPRRRDSRSILSGAELSDLAKSQSSIHGKSFIRTMLSVYIVLTAGCSLLLRITGMGWFDAVTNAMSSCSTCGFCVRNASIASYSSLSAELIIVFFMTISAVSFIQIASVFMGWSGRSFRLSAATRSFIVFLALASAAVTADLMYRTGGSFGHCLRLAVFQVCSITTTTGFSTADTTLWPPLSIAVLVIASVVCGCSGSTSGGVKMDRIVLVGAYIRDGFSRCINPHRVTGVRVDGRMISDDSVSEAVQFVMIYVSVLIVGALFNIVAGLDLVTGTTASVACLGNVGPGFGSVGSMGNYAAVSDAVKLFSSVMMVAGRLEIIPLISFFGIVASDR